MDPARKRTVRLVVALSAAVLLAGALVYTSFSASSEARSPSQLLSRRSRARRYQLTGKVVEGYSREGTVTTSGCAIATATSRCPCATRACSPTRSGRGARSSSTSASRASVFVGEKDSLVTKCPSKFTADSRPDVLVAGHACLILALGVCLYGIGASLYGARAGRREWVDSGRRAVYALAGTAVVAFVILEVAFVRSDFSFALVATHSSTTTPIFYRATAMWSSQEGSLLLWLMLLALWSSLILFVTRRRLREIAPYATAVLLGLGAFFARCSCSWSRRSTRRSGPCRPRASASTRCCGTRA